MKPHYDKLMNTKLDSTEEQFKELLKLLGKISMTGQWHQRYDIVDMSFKAKQIVESLEEKFDL
jgi:hypothetical protein